MALSLTVSERTRRVVASDLDISIIGECNYPSPLAGRLAESAIHYVGQADRVLLEDRISAVLQHSGVSAHGPAFELAGPRHQVFFDTARLRCGIVTCGGLCPGLNNVVRGLVLAARGVSGANGFAHAAA
jgi:6-phosphofructokinase 1